MKTCVHLWQILSDVFLEWEMFQTEIVEKIKEHIVCWFFFLRTMTHLLLLHGKHGYANEPHCYITLHCLSC